MEVILLEKVHKLGELGDIVRVRSGYARNYLIPKGKAVAATAENRAAVQARRAELERVAAERLAEARARAERLEGAHVQVQVRASEEGKLFGSVSPADIAAAAKAAGVELAKSEIQTPGGPIKAVGEYELLVVLHPEVQVKITVSVVGES